MAEKKEERSEIEAYQNDPLYIAPNESTQMQLTPMEFDGTNYMTWSRGVRLALGAKNKMGIIDGSVKEPERNSKDYVRWMRCDHMVRCWLFRSMKEEIAHGFILVESARQLWEEIKERYSQSNALLLYQIKRDAGSLEQGNLSVSDYYGKLKKLWDENSELEVLPTCTCGVMKRCTCEIIKRLQQREEQGRIIDILMKLDPIYDGTRCQILAMDPLPQLNKVFQMVHQAEREKKIAGNLQQSSNEATAMSANKQMPQGGGFNKRESKRSKMEKLCSHCGFRGHVKEECFKLTGVPEWYVKLKGRKTQRTAANVSRVNEEKVVDTPMDLDEYEAYKKADPEMINTITQQVMKLLSERQSGGASSSKASTSGTANFAGKFISQMLQIMNI